MTGIICLTALVASATVSAVFAVTAVKTRRKYRRALAALARPVDGQPLGARNLRILAAIERDTEQHPVEEPAYRTGRSS